LYENKYVHSILNFKNYKKLALSFRAESRTIPNGVLDSDSAMEGRGAKKYSG
jgi:hypothetical protein